MRSDDFKNRKPDTEGALIFSLLMVISMIIWGGSWVSAKILAQKLSPEMLSFWRFLLSFISLAPFVLLRPEDRKIRAAGFIYSALGALCMSAYMYFFFKGLEHWLAGQSGVLMTSMIPLMTLLIAITFFGKRPRTMEIMGLLLGLSGAAILLKAWELDWTLFWTSDSVLFIVCPFIWAWLTICSQRAAESVSSYMFSLITFGVAALIYLPFAAAEGLTSVFSQDMTFWINMIYLSIISGTGATTVYFISAEKLGSYRTSAFVFLVPFSALLLSWLFLGEIPELTTLFGGAVSIAAVYIINRYNSQSIS